MTFGSCCDSGYCFCYFGCDSIFCDSGCGGCLILVVVVVPILVVVVPILVVVVLNLNRVSC